MVANRPSQLDLHVANQIAASILASDQARTAWKRVSTLRNNFSMEGEVFSKSQRERMQGALLAAGLEPDPPITAVNRNGTVKLRPHPSGALSEINSGSDPSRTQVAPEASVASSKRVFLSYRREDCQAQANGLNDGLRQRLKDAEIFMDVDTIPPGTDFEEFIRNWIQNADIVLALIGDNWLDKDSEGQRRIDNPDDFVRLELRAALEQNKTVMPVRVENARMPSSTELPPDISRIARIQSIELSDLRWRDDMNRLARVVESAAATERQRDRLQTEPDKTEPVDQTQRNDDLEELVSDDFEFPSRFSDRWFRDHVPGMSTEQLIALTSELESRGWWRGEVIDRAYIHADPTLVPRPPGESGDPAKAKPFDIPSRITRAWLAAKASELDDHQAATVVEVLLQRGWTAGEIEDHFACYRR